MTARAAFGCPRRDRIAAQKGEIQLICFVNGVIDEVLESGQYMAWYNQFAGQQ